MNRQLVSNLPPPSAEEVVEVVLPYQYQRIGKAVQAVACLGTIPVWEESFLSALQSLETAINLNIAAEESLFSTLAPAGERFDNHRQSHSQILEIMADIYVSAMRREAITAHTFAETIRYQLTSHFTQFDSELGKSHPSS